MQYTVSIDDDLLARASKALGTASAQETIERGLREVVSRADMRPLPPRSAAEGRLPARTDLTALLAERNVEPIQSLEQLRGDFWPEDEDIDDFVAAVRKWRKEGT